MLVYEAVRLCALLFGGETGVGSDIVLMPCLCTDALWDRTDALWDGADVLVGHWLASWLSGPAKI